MPTEENRQARRRAEQAARIAARIACAHGHTPLQALAVQEQVRRTLSPPPLLALPQPAPQPRRVLHLGNHWARLARAAG